MITLLPPTKGTAAQIAWAYDIVREFSERYQDALKTLTPLQIVDLNRQSAAFWINNRGKRGLTFIKCFVDRKQIKTNKRRRFEKAIERMTRDA